MSSQEKSGYAPPRYLLQKIRLAHCQRGPERCEKCRQMDREAICLLDINPPDQGLAARRVIEVIWQGETSWREFDVMRSFDSWEEAKVYLAEEGLEAIIVRRS